MTTKEFINKLSEQHGISKRKAKQIVEMYNETFFDCIVSGEEIKLWGLFKIGTKTRVSRKCADPKTGEIIQVPEMKVPYVLFSKKIKDIIKS